MSSAFWEFHDFVLSPHMPNMAFAKETNLNNNGIGIKLNAVMDKLLILNSVVGVVGFLKHGNLLCPNAISLCWHI